MSMTVKLRVWRQAGPDQAGRLVEYVADRVSPDMSFLEMLDVVNAALAVIRWKKLLGYYSDGTRDYYCGYSIRANDIVNEPTDDASGIA